MLRQVLLGGLTLCALALVGCATSYKPAGLGGGYSEMALSQDTYRVAFRGNEFTAPDTVQNYALRRAAELTLDKGYRHFVVLDKQTTVETQVTTTPATVKTQSVGESHDGHRHTHHGNMHDGSSFHAIQSGYHPVFGRDHHTSHRTTVTTIEPASQTETHEYTAHLTIKMLHNKRGYPQAYDAAVIAGNYQPRAT